MHNEGLFCLRARKLASAFYVIRFGVVGKGKMKTALVVEPFASIAQVMQGLLEDLGFHVEVVTSEAIDEGKATSGHYDVAIINIDQNNRGWRNYGLYIASMVKKAGVPVIMIPDYRIDVRTIERFGWLMLTKPFTIGSLQEAVERAMSEQLNRPAEAAQ